MKLSTVQMVAFGAVVIGDLLFTLEVLFVGPTFAKMFADFGGTLPWLTRLMFEPAVLALSIVPIGLALLGVQKRNTGLIVAGAVVSFAVVALFYLAMYLPIFELSGNIRAE